MKFHFFALLNTFIGVKGHQKEVGVGLSTGSKRLLENLSSKIPEKPLQIRCLILLEFYINILIQLRIELN